MANLIETAEWAEGIYQLEKSDPVVGGPDGIDNKPLKQLANRTKWLKEQQAQMDRDISSRLNGKADTSHTHTLDQINGLLAALGLKANLDSPILTGIPKAPTATLGTNTNQIATTAFVAQAIAALVGSAPATLDTLAEIAAALTSKDDTVSNLLAEIAKRAIKSSTLSGYGITDAVRVVADIPSAHLGTDVIEVLSMMRTFYYKRVGDFTGYISPLLGQRIYTASKDPLPGTVFAQGQNLSKSDYPALFAFAQYNNLVKTASEWVEGAHWFVDLGNGDFKIPDLRGTFSRAIGPDPDNANANMTLGEFRSFRMPAIKGDFVVRALTLVGDKPSGVFTGDYEFTAASKSNPIFLYSQATQYPYHVNMDTSRKIKDGAKIETENTVYNICLGVY